MENAAALRRIGAFLPVPTEQQQVNEMLISLGHQLKSAESAAERRERLMMVMAQMHLNGETLPTLSGPKPLDSNTSTKVKASEALIYARTRIRQAAADLSQHRLDAERAAAHAYSSSDVLLLETQLNKHRVHLERYRNLDIAGTEAGFARPVSGVAFTPEATFAGDWAGKLYKVNSHQMEIVDGKQVHDGKVCLTQSRHGILSGGIEGNIVLSDCELESKAMLKHSVRVATVDEHPSIDYIAGAYFDCTWKLYDLETRQMLLDQHGHSKQVYTVKFHPDGALLASSGLDGITRIWDIRSGESIMTVKKHVREIYASAWSPNGYVLATGGADNNILVTDLRAQHSEVIPAHTSIVTDLRYSGEFLLSSSYDKTVKIWTDLHLVKTLCTTAKVLCADGLEGTVVCGKWDRTVEFFSN